MDTQVISCAHKEKASQYVALTVGVIHKPAGIVL